MVRAGVIGLGKMGMSHYAILNTHPNVQLVAVCDSTGFIISALDKLGDIATFKNYQKMLDQCRLDCVVIATPTSTHAEIVRYAMENGIHVFVEKPFCLNLWQGRELVDMAEQQNIINQVGYHYRFVASFDKARQLLQRRAIGDVYHFTAEAYGQVVVKPKIKTWRTKSTEGGGCLYDYSSHVINLVDYLVGPPDGISGTVLKNIFSEDVSDAVYSTLLYDNGITGHLAVNWSDKTYRKMSTQIEICGVGGKIVADRQECRVFLWDNDGFEDLEDGWNIFYTTDLTKPAWFYLRGEEYSHQIDYFVRCIKDNGLENINSFASAFQTDVIIDLLKNDAGQRSSHYGQNTVWRQPVFRH